MDVKCLVLFLALAKCLNSKRVLSHSCGCMIYTDDAGTIEADCSHRNKIDTDYVCLAKRNPSKLVLSDNNLTEFPEVLLANSSFQNLMIVDVSHNNIEQLPVEAISRYKQLYISDNRLKVLPPLNGTELEFLDISFNNITSSKWFLNDTISIIETEGNPMKCECGYSTRTKILYPRIQKGELPDFKCMDNNNGELELFVNNQPCYNQVNDDVTDEPSFISMILTKIFAAFLLSFSFVGFCSCFWLVCCVSHGESGLN